MQSGDIKNAYITAPNREKKWTRSGPEFGHDKGKVLIVTRALYELKSDGAAFRAFLAERLNTMVFKSSNSYPEVWLRTTVKSNGEEYYEYILVYVDDILAISTKSKEVMQEISDCFKFKNNMIEPPEIYLVGRLEKNKLGSITSWTLTSKNYLKAAIHNL